MMVEPPNKIKNIKSPSSSEHEKEEEKRLPEGWKNTDEILPEGWAREEIKEKENVRNYKGGRIEYPEIENLKGVKRSSRMVGNKQKKNRAELEDELAILEAIKEAKIISKMMEEMGGNKKTPGIPKFRNSEKFRTFEIPKFQEIPKNSKKQKGGGGR